MTSRFREVLDPVMIVTVKQVLRRAASKGTTVFLITHVLHVAHDLIDQYGILRAGGLVAQGDAASFRAAGLTLEQGYLEFDIPKDSELEWLG